MDSGFASRPGMTGVGRVSAPSRAISRAHLLSHPPAHTAHSSHQRRARAAHHTHGCPPGKPSTAATAPARRPRAAAHHGRRGRACGAGHACCFARARCSERSFGTALYCRAAVRAQHGGHRRSLAARWPQSKGRAGRPIHPEVSSAGSRGEPVTP